MSLRITSQPGTEPVILDDALLQLREDDERQRDRIERLITSARKYVEEITWLQLITATYEWKLDRLCGDLYVPRPPLQSLTSIAYVDANGDAQTLSGSLYTVDTTSLPGRIVPAVNQSWPTTQGHIQDVTITFVAGYGTTGDSVPEPIRDAILLVLEDLYESGGCEKRMKAVNALLSPYRVYDPRVTRWL